MVFCYGVEHGGEGEIFFVVGGDVDEGCCDLVVEVQFVQCFYEVLGYVLV